MIPKECIRSIEVDAMTRPMQVREDEAPNGKREDAR